MVADGCMTVGLSVSDLLSGKRTQDMRENQSMEGMSWRGHGFGNVEPRTRSTSINSVFTCRQVAASGWLEAPRR